jgi:hypothetical protein
MADRLPTHPTMEWIVGRPSFLNQHTPRNSLTHSFSKSNGVRRKSGGGTQSNAMVVRMTNAK